MPVSKRNEPIIDMPTRLIMHLSSTSGPGGAEMLVSRIASGLDQARFRSHVGLFAPGWLKDRCEKESLPTVVLPMQSQWDVAWIARCCAVVRSQRVDLIHAHEFRANVYGAIVAKLCGVPLVGTVHGKNYYPDQVKRRMAYRWVSKTATMVAVSEDLRLFLQDRVGVPRDRITRIYNGVDMPERLSREGVAQFRCDLGIQPSEFAIGIVGSLYPVKGHRHLFDAFRSVLKLQPKTKLLVVGQGDLEPSLKQQAFDLGIDHAVSFLGLRNDVPNILAALDLFVLPSLSEGLSVALLEAMSTGVPVVASRVGGNPEIVQDGQTGLLVSPENAQELADRILEMITHREKAKLFGERGRERVSQNFTTARMLGHYQDLYTECLSGTS